MNRLLVPAVMTIVALLVCTPAAVADGWHHDRDTTDWAHSAGPHRYLDRDRGDRGDEAHFYGEDRWSDDSDDEDDSDDADDESEDSSGEGTDVEDSPVEAETGVEAALGGAVKSGAAQTIQVQTTSYNHADNAGSNNATICCGVLHKEASGDGTFQNPITLAVPGSGGSGMQTPAGTRVYFVKYQFYGIVEDSGASPQSLRRFDIWSDGRGLSTSAGSDCMDRLTGTSTAILNPPAGKPVAHVGPLGDASGCHVPG